MDETHPREQRFEVPRPLQDAQCLKAYLATEGLRHPDHDLMDGPVREELPQVLIELFGRDGLQRAGEGCPRIGDRNPRVSLADVQGGDPAGAP